MCSKRLAVYSRRSAIGFAASIGKRQNIPSIHLVVQRVESAGRAIPSLCHATPSATSEHLMGLLDSSPIPRSLIACCVSFQLRPLPSTGITRLPRYYGPLRHPRRPGLSLTSCRLIAADHRWGFPCCVWSPLSACRRQYPGRTDGLRSLVLSHRRRPSPIIGGSAPALPVSGPAQRSLSLRPADSPSRQSDPLHRRLQQLRYLHYCSDCYRVERTSSRAGLSPTVNQRLFTAHAKVRLAPEKFRYRAP